MAHDHLQPALENSSAASLRSDHEDAWFAMRLSLIFGFLMLIAKTAAYFLTGSSAILADAAESVVHVVAIAFAAFSLRLSIRPAAPTFMYGYERISFFSAGFEGALIVLAAVVILFNAIREWLTGSQLQELSIGTVLVLAAAVVNALLGWYLMRTGRRVHSLILTANGKHVLTDSWTSFGIVLGLTLVLFTHWTPFDPLVAIIVAVNILWSGGHLIWRSAQGLLDYSDPQVGHEIREKLDAICAELHVHYHNLRFRSTGHRQLIEVHLLFPGKTPVDTAHRIATLVEDRLPAALSMPAEVITHLESEEDHAVVHSHSH